MQRKQLFAFYCTLTVPVGVAAGLVIGQIIGLVTAPVILGVAAGCCSAAAMLGRAKDGGKGRGIQRL